MSTDALATAADRGTPPADGGLSAEVGLRERKKDATRRALAERALQLALERGYGGFTIAELVDEVGVSRRTFSNYFTSKAECIAAVTEGWLDDVLQAIRQEPAEASLIDVLQTGLMAVARDGVERWGALHRVAAAEPDLTAQLLACDEATADVVALEAAARVGLEPGDIRVRLLATFAVTAGREVVARWAPDGRPGDNAELAALLHTAFSILNIEGLAEPFRT